MLRGQAQVHQCQASQQYRLWLMQSKWHYMLGRLSGSIGTLCTMDFRHQNPESAGSGGG